MILNEDFISFSLMTGCKEIKAGDITRSYQQDISMSRKKNIESNTTKTLLLLVTF